MMAICFWEATFSYESYDLSDCHQLYNPVDISGTMVGESLACISLSGTVVGEIWTMSAGKLH